MVVFGNLSGADAAIANVLCRMATCGGPGERALYTNRAEHVTRVQNPVLLNGIPSLLARGDLADRAIAITLPAIPDDWRRPEAEVWRDFGAAAPGILALLLDALVLALRNASALKLPQLPPMDDCARRTDIDWSAEDMLAALEYNRAGTVAGWPRPPPLLRSSR